MYRSGFRSLFRGRASPAVSAIVLVSFFLAASLFVGTTGGRPAFPGGTAHAPRSSSASPASSAAGGPTGAAPVHPQGGVQKEKGTFFENDSTFAGLPSNRTPCGGNDSNYSFNFTSPPYTYYYNTLDVFHNCYAGAQSPSTVSLGNNEIGVGYSVLSNQSMVGCNNTPDVETSQVAFQLSPNAGASFGPPTWIGNSSCAYLQALEPSFTLSSSGDIYGAFVEANYGNATNHSFPFNFFNRTDDALAFTKSTNSGGTFSNPVTLPAAGGSYIARPEVAAIGQSIYIVYENINNNTSIDLQTPYPYVNGPAQHPIALEVLSSVDGGVTWSGPVTLPGLNASAGYNAMSPSIAVSSTGTVAVAYATNRSCFQSFFGTCNGWGDTIVVATSSTNGSSWTGPVPVSPNATGEYQCAGWNNDTGPNYYYYCFSYVFQWEPSTSVGWSDVAANDLYVAWAGGFSIYNSTDLVTFYGTSAVFSAASSDSGAHWNDSVVAENTNQNYPFELAFYYTPVVGVSHGWVYVSYAEENDSYCYPCTPGTIGHSYWLATSLDGVRWMGNLTLLLWNPYSYVTNAFTGYTESMGFSTGGPVVTFSQPTSDWYSFGYAYNDTLQGTNYWFNDTYWNNETGWANLTTVFVWNGNTTLVNFTETGLPAGTTWNFSLGTAKFSSNLSTIQVTNVPLGPGLTFLIPNLPNGFWSLYSAFASVNGTPVFNASTNVTVAFVVEYGIAFYIQPATSPYFAIDVIVNGTYYYYDRYGPCPTCFYANPEFPWYFPVGTHVTLLSTDVYSAYPISFWTGTGNGSSNNFGNSTNLTVDGAINETAWSGAYGSYNVTFVPQGLPGGTTYNFTFGGAAHQGVAPANVTIAGVVTGAYAVSGVVAPGSGGYVYFGQVAGGDEVYIPANPVVVLNFSYAYVDVAASPGTVTFQASGLAAGDPWQLAFNGTTYSGNTPWINITTRPGTFAVSASPVEAAFNDTAQYQPSGLGPTQAVTLGATYPVTYSPTYRVVVVGGVGGTVTGTGSHWLAPGSNATYSAHPIANYIFLGWTGTGAGSYSGPGLNASILVRAPITESAAFEALPVDRFNLSVGQTGLPAGVWWTVELNGVGYSTTGATLLIPDLYPCSSGSGGSYTVGVPIAYVNGTSGIRYVPSGFPHTTCTNGATQISVVFTEQFQVTPISLGGGSAAVQVMGVPQSSAAWVPAGTTAGIEASPEVGYAFSGWVGSGPGSYTGPTANDELTPTGPVSEVAYFTLIAIPPPPVYGVSFHAVSGWPAGTAWSLVFNNTHYASSGPFINVSGYPNGTYALSVPTVFSSDRLSEYLPNAAPPSFTVNGGGSQPIQFSAEYYVAVSATTGGTVVSPTSGYVASGKSIDLNATPGLGYSFVGWTGSGSGSYTGTTDVTSVVVTGPVTEVASFAPIPATAPSGGGTGLSSTPILVALAVVGLVVGVAVGYAAFRRRTPAPGEGAPGGGEA